MIIAIFDLDGTIADTICDLGDAVNHGLDELGCPTHTYEEYKKFVGNGAAKLCYRALPDNRKDDADKLHGIFKEYYSLHYLDKTKLYPRIKETLQTLSDDGVKLAVATNKPQDAARAVVKALLPEIDFIAVLGGCEERPKKPDRAIVDEILSVLPEGERTVYMIGDSNVDIQTAKNAGLISVGCTWGFRGRAELEAEGADFIAESADDILTFIPR